MNTPVKVKRIGLLTGGGDAPGLNAVIRAVVKAAIREYGLSVVGFLNGFGGLIKNQARELTEKDVIGILPRGGTILGTTNRDNPFHYPVIKGGKKVYVDVSDRIFENISIHGVDALVVIGGDGSLAIARELFDKGLPVVGVPKTIDNDLLATDQTFGFDTALTTATEALDKLHTTAESHHRVMVLEVMGRYAGWIALAAGIAGGADVILIPEIPYRIEKVIDMINQREIQGKKFSIIVVAEGAKPVDGELVVQKRVEDSFDPIRLGGIGHVVAQQVEEATGKETRVTILGHLQRGGSPTAFDRILATRYGTGAVRLVMEGRFGHMVCLRGAAIDAVPLSEATGQVRSVPLDSDLLLSARQLGICLGD
ncbi:6-phosphofructokinase [Desulfofundulus thermocisternus]|uniref:6-phosphofructokinase n=1 Tax=Desulfofundulus thermocisternus TaxID=42471 RepID=UPI001A109974|nr:ATP-dependent 6-phosphofructokinase [Desulfofundulus thermocisternus]MBE3585058.1 ATP-dependent 6-phosphofructokinase [Thermoanaerobacter sp.]MCS5695880.1 ATP-dependent 6-phosphofructokinase [Desulfofundulus thermocisternus]